MHHIRSKRAFCRFCVPYFRSVVEYILSRDLETGKAILRDYLNATRGFKTLCNLTQKRAKSLMRMFGPKGNPQGRYLVEVIGYLQKGCGVRLGLHPIRSSDRKVSGCTLLLYLHRLLVREQDRENPQRTKERLSCIEKICRGINGFP